MDIRVTESAKLKLFEMGVSEDTFLRIGVKSGGCSGNTYDAVLDSNMSEVDEVYFSEGNLRIVSDKVSSVFLDGLTVDFSNDLIEPGFRLTNANAKGSCGCGSSFSTGDPAPNVDVSFSV
jgi:iron-sulfur cluster assembly protein